jgi:hypothetical protein
MNIDMTFWDEVFKTGLFLEKKHFFIFKIEQERNLPISILK